MAQNPIGLNQGTQTFINFDDGGGTVNTQIVTVGTIQGGTISALPNLPGGSIAITTGTIASLPNLPGGSVVVTNGTISALPNSVVSNLGTAGDAGTLPVVAGENWYYGNTGARWARAREIENAVNSTGIGIQSVGLIGQFDDVSPTSITENQFGNVRFSANRNLYNTIRDAAGNERGVNVTAANELLTAINTGTINVATASVSSIPNIPGGTINILAGGTLGILSNGSIHVTAGTDVITSGSIAVIAGTITAGTLTNLTSGTINAATAVLNSGTINVATAVITTLPNLPQGSINVTAGTIGAGTFQINPINAGSAIVTAGTTSSGTIGTLVAAPGAGTSIYVTGVQVLQTSGTAESVVSFGLQAAGNQVLARGNFPAGGGITEQDTYPSTYGTTNSAITWNQLSGSGTTSYKVKYFVHT